MSDVTLSDITETILERFTSNWTATSVYTFENEDFTNPSPDTAWVRLVVRGRGSKQWTLGQVGNRIFQRDNSIIVQIFTPKNKGTGPSDVIVQAVRDLFEGVTFGYVQCYDANVKYLGFDGLWYSVAVEVDFHYNETK